MKIKTFENYGYDSFKTKITTEHFKVYADLKERVSTLAFIIYENENGKEFDEDGFVDWNQTNIEDLMYSHATVVYVVLSDGTLDTKEVEVPKDYILNPDILVQSNKYNM